MSGMMYDPSDGMKTSKPADTRPRRMPGRNTVQKAAREVAPRSRAASIRVKSNFSALA